MVLMLAIGVFLAAIIIIGVVWVFYPAISCRREKSKARNDDKIDEFRTVEGISKETDQLLSKSNCDISIVVPAYNEVGCVLRDDDVNNLMISSGITSSNHVG